MRMSILETNKILKILHASRNRIKIQRTIIRKEKRFGVNNVDLVRAKGKIKIENKIIKHALHILRTNDLSKSDKKYFARLKQVYRISFGAYYAG